mmetsp:Transcript_35902/g.89464  ORF Transcript_35902/g.89464 Transcript_35902/m.89464 type:complete len:178 (-) Transcript_35902:15-548(-)
MPSVMAAFLQPVVVCREACPNTREGPAAVESLAMGCAHSARFLSIVSETIDCSSVAWRSCFSSLVSCLYVCVDVRRWLRSTVSRWRAAGGLCARAHGRQSNRAVSRASTSTRARVQGGERKSESFSVKKYGDDEAKQMAIAYRRDMEALHYQPDEMAVDDSKEERPKKKRKSRGENE